MDSIGQSARRGEKPHHPTGGPYAWFTLFVLILAYTLSFVDRQALTLLVGPIRASLSISDTQLSLLHGFAFAIFYTVMGIPMGRMTDRHRRTWIIAAGIAVWSAMTALCGLSRSFAQMFLARIGVGVGEAALSPAAYSILSDSYPPRQLPLALSLYMGSAYVGAGLATMIGGAVIAMLTAVDLPALGHEPWRMVFLVIGLPGLLLALLVLTLREPARHGIKQRVQPRFSEVLRHMGDHGAAYSRVIIGYGLSGMMWNGGLAWLPTFFIRRFGWTAPEVGSRFGLALVVTGAVGVVTGGMLAGALRRRGMEDANLRVGLISIAVSLPGAIWGMLAGSEWLSLAGVSLFLFGCALPYGPAAAALQEITPNQMRGQVSAIYLFTLSFLGVGLGATMVALFTDHIFASDAAVGKSLLAMILLTAPAAALTLWAACRPYRAALATTGF